MTEPFSPVPDDHDVLRFVVQGGRFFPPGHTHPDPDWLIPTSKDKEEAARRGRVPGLSVWDTHRCRLSQARKLAERPHDHAYVAHVAALRGVAASLLPPSHPLDVVTDPLTARRGEPGWDGHALIEGLARPAGAPKQVWTELRERLTAHFRPAP